MGRYTHRVGISNQRLVSLRGDAVVFRTRGDARMRLPVAEFAARFLDHVLPRGFRKVRHYGLLAPTNVRTRLARAGIPRAVGPGGATVPVAVLAHALTLAPPRVRPTSGRPAPPDAPTVRAGPRRRRDRAPRRHRACTQPT